MTSHRSPAEAVSTYRSDVQRQVSCVTDAVVGVGGGYYPSSEPHFLAMNNGLPAALGGASRLRFRLQQNYRIVESGSRGNAWQVDVVGYNYAVLDSNLTEVILYHWHPIGNSHVETPHLHLEQGAQVGRREVRDAHLPTGQVPLHAILRLLIQDLGVRPRRNDWEAVLAD